MRSWRELAGIIIVGLALAACGTDSVPRGDDGEGSGDPIPVDPDVCEDSYLDYNNFGAPFVINWCRGCHSSEVPMTMRQKAPLQVNFDGLDDVRTWSERILARAATTSPTMPPAGGPSEAERALLAEWIACGVK